MSSSSEVVFKELPGIESFRKPFPDMDRIRPPPPYEESRQVLINPSNPEIDTETDSATETEEDWQL